MPSIEDQAVEDGQGAKLAVSVSVLELLANGTGGFGGTGVLDLDDLDEVGDAAKVIFFVRFAGEELDLCGDGRVWLFLRQCQTSKLSKLNGGSIDSSCVNNARRAG